MIALLGRGLDVSSVVIGTEIRVASVWIGEQVPGDHQDGATDGDHSAGLPRRRAMRR